MNAETGVRTTIQLSDNVKSRATFTGDDSLINTQEQFFTPNDTSVGRQPSPMRAPNISSLLSIQNIENQEELASILIRVADADNLSTLHEIKNSLTTNRVQYFECQIHGQVTVEDIEEITVVGGESTPEIIELADQLGISISYR